MTAYHPAMISYPMIFEDGPQEARAWASPRAARRIRRVPGGVHIVKIVEPVREGAAGRQETHVPGDAGVTRVDPPTVASRPPRTAAIGA